MPRATWQGVVIAQAHPDQVLVVENNVYFPVSAVRQEYLQPSSHTSVCGWKGTASYYDVVVDGRVNFNAAWVYHAPLASAGEIAGYLAFWKGVHVEG